ncbi:MAG: DUF4185 domain-containing protein [Rhodococcus sp. (in: high G+C Gram-positive bacteria)]|uniref:DUF4185 domain-containing protein n=1 Tax=Rhodococcus sp. TaxID=1831 RepID=UPI003BAEAC9E
MKPVRSACTLSAALAVAMVSTVSFAGTAGAAPCGGSGGGSSGFGSSSSGTDPDGPQGPLPVLSGSTRTVAWVTGPVSANRTNTRFSISGTDLGIMWDNGGTGAQKQILSAMGDTFGDCSVDGQQWRRNVLMRSSDANLADGITVPNPQPGNLYAGSPVTAAAPNFSREILPSIGVYGVEATVVPTAGISVGGTQYVNFMSVRAWGEPGVWDTNASTIATSTDNGENWIPVATTTRVNTPLDVPGIQQLALGNSNFQQHAYVKNGGFVYDYGTPNGRFGPAHVARIPEAQILDLAAYEYWNGSAWVLGDADAATPVFGPEVGEMSVHWNGSKYIAVYGNERLGRIDMRTSPTPEGPWSEPRALVTSSQIAGLYAPYIHPWSTGNDLYFVASRWEDYNIMLLHTTID